MESTQMVVRSVLLVLGVARLAAFKETSMITRILVPTDFSEPSDAALAYAKALAAQFGASLHLIHVVEDPVVTGVFGTETYIPDSPGFSAGLRSEAEQHLATRLTPAEREKFNATTELLNGVSAPTIIEAARDRAIDLIVMGTHGRTGVAHALMGSVTERVVRTAHCPVLTMHAMVEPVMQAAPAWSAAQAPA